MVAKVGLEALWLEVAHATVNRPTAPEAPRTAPAPSAPTTSEAAAAESHAKPAAPESKVWAALVAQSQSTVRALGDLTRSIQSFSDAKDVTGSEPRTKDPAPAATAFAAAESGESAPDFPWPGWPRAPRPRTEPTAQPWRPFAVPISPVQAEPQPAA